MKLISLLFHFCTGLSSSNQTSEAARHAHNTWTIDSTSLRQIGHRLALTTFFFPKFSLVGSILRQAFQMNCLTHGCALSPHIPFQKLSSPSPLEVSSLFLLPCIYSKWYAFFIENRPSEEKPHTLLSLCKVQLN
ncbi:hypothetical protein I3843_16G060600 [Carya illinoinensis]|nr:hypothetical protein I3843_16G060600 [Carya illinoinensis]